jgi:hypothetical protein
VEIDYLDSRIDLASFGVIALLSFALELLAKSVTAACPSL